MKTSDHPEIEIQCDGYDIFVVVNSVKIAKRGHANTPQARTWISLEPGWQVRGIKRLEISYEGAPVH